MLYLPDRYDRAALVAAFLPYYNVELRTVDFPDAAKLARKHGGHLPQVVQLVGGGGWHHPSLAVRGGSAVQGALVVDVYGGDTVGGDAATFASALQKRIGRAPSAAAAQAYDAAMMMAAARSAASGAVDPRSAMRKGMATVRLDDGACGPATMGADGEIVRTPSVLEVSGSELIVAP
jgi:ABC-type branched-subunit amino acid transport system substrate-binding protein